MWIDMNKMDSKLLKNSWKRCWDNTFHDHNSDMIRDTVIWNYCEPLRKYHNIKHLINCIKSLNNVYTLAREPRMIEIALWYHDLKEHPLESCYKMRTDMCKASVNSGCEEIIKYRLNVYLMCHELIINTMHKQIPETNDGKLICDIDIEVFGTDYFETYCEKIREEYDDVIDQHYYIERLECLNNFYNRKYIYHTEFYRDLYETKAQKNLEGEINKLKILANIK